MELTTCVAATEWSAAPPSLVLCEGELHVWQADAGSYARHEAALKDLISPVEADKANRYRQSSHRNRSMFARAVLRDILGRYTGSDPRTLRFCVTSSGKPLLDPEVHADAPQFSLSHSGDLVLLAFARRHAVGVDVEAIRDDIDVMEIARQFFAPGEASDLLTLPAESRPSSFFAAWTRKEAYLKARGEGIGSGLNRFAVSVLPGVPARLVSDERSPQDVGAWRLSTVPIGSGSSASIAVRCDGLRSRHWVWCQPLHDRCLYVA
jgi:4'-phosphopantetheinyl transferase